MTVLAWLLGLMLPACAAVGAHGLPPPVLRDFTHLVRPASPNTALAAPAGFVPVPDVITPVYPVPQAVLFAALRRLAGGQERTFLAASFPAQGQIDWVVRSAVWNFPDLVTAQVLPDGARSRGSTSSRLILYSRSVYGYGDFGVNRRRLQTWLAALQAVLAASKPPASP